MYIFWPRSLQRVLQTKCKCCIKTKKKRAAVSELGAEKDPSGNKLMYTDEDLADFESGDENEDEDD